MARRERVIVVDPMAPAALDSGLNVLVAEFVRLLAEVDDIVFVGLSGPEGQVHSSIADSCADVRLAPRQRPHPRLVSVLRHLVQLLLGTVTGTPLSAFHDSPRRLRRLVAQESERGARAIFVVHSFACRNVTAAPDVPSALLLIDVQSDARAQALEIAMGWRRLLAWHQMWTTQRFERRWLRKVDLVLTTQPADALRVLELAGGEGEVADLPVVVPARPEQERDPLSLRVGFVGVLDHWPNADAVQWFVGSVWPCIKAEVAGAEFVTFGPSSDPDSLPQGDGVTHCGWVDDLSEPLRSVAVFVAPMRYGTGIKVKLLDSLARGDAVVATSFAVRGLHVVDGSVVLVRDDPGAFAAAVVALLADPVERERLGQAARRTWLEWYSPAAGREAMAAVRARLRPRGAR